MEFIDDNIIYLTSTNNTTPTSFEIDVILATAVLSAVLSIATCVAHGALLYVIYKDPFKKFRKPTTVFFVSLSLADLISGGLAELFYAIRLFLRSDAEGNKIEVLFLAQKIITHFIVNISVLIVTAMSMDRFLAIYKPLKHRVWVTPRRVVACNVIIWFYSILFTMTGLFLSPEVFFQLDLHLHTTIPVIIMISSYIGIYLLITKNHRKRMNMVAPTNTNGPISERNMRVQKRVSAAILIVIILIFLGLMPYFVIANVGISCKECVKDNWFIFFNYFSLTFLFINSALNPWLYAWRLMDYRQAFYSLLHITTPVLVLSDSSATDVKRSNARGVSITLTVR